MKNKIAELKAQLTKESPHARERSASSSGEKETQGFTFVSVYKVYMTGWCLYYDMHV